MTAFLGTRVQIAFGMERPIAGLVAVIALCLGQPEASAFGVDFSRGKDAPPAVGFEADVMVEGTLEEPLGGGLYLAWQSEMVSSAGDLRPVGGHWGFQLLPRIDRRGPVAVHTFNFGWEFDRAVLPIGEASLVRSAPRGKPFAADVSARMKAEIERNISRRPDKPNLFLAYFGDQGAMAGTDWPDGLLGVCDWRLNRWYRVRLVRDVQPVTKQAWVLARDANGRLGFPPRPVPAEVYAWRTSLTPLTRHPDGSFGEAARPISLPAFYLQARYDSLRTFNCWGEALGSTPARPVRWLQVRPRDILADGSRRVLPRATVGFWGYNQPDNDAGPLGHSPTTHSFYIAYRGRVKDDGRSFPIMDRRMRNGGLLWADDAEEQPTIFPEARLIRWDERRLSAYLNSPPGVAYSGRPIGRQGAAQTIHRTVTVAPGADPEFTFAPMFGPGAERLTFAAHSHEQGWLTRSAQGFRVSPGAPGGKAFHVQIEAFVPGSPNTVGWIDLVVQRSGRGGQR